ncbi:hypothetical protein EOA27_31810 [Mesorhizobium sp. M2A.F.Ca.ET.037.01.1.1]|uniref:hypothetical protein n=2 Tax=Mesorhizobium TaxID=68287 RepID=UPI000F75A0DB|nr:MULTISPECIES: hypothetical protein [unclassified Mesorhizobium]RUY00122.1 hypothetical protein EOA25_24990 [Mesorhizobium sp. M2A.F.Ca.ET.040.01.1.1]RVC57886.1 hypothetical protein EN759_35100 [Mesorhizobium sp. M00.F.Ca.ET.038.03.1.1]RVC67359.1 hypothetical protein EN766_31795 [Mesorhizobium sp. M2A.F.Ca.ET.046.02.1.1]AZO38183.1 hypothetical protein EJ072_29835 [Mesorhizobium sp. M2A.F.Ca.ET.046.03.2.1]RUX02754.1 hypothetical protein EOA27_31810 [Mesorhizobium sp. M2A.F.Ca.ET.037.01.1.1]
MIDRMIQIKAKPIVPDVSSAVLSEEMEMPTESLIVVTAIVAYFATFMAVLAYVTMAESRHLPRR